MSRRSFLRLDILPRWVCLLTFHVINSSFALVAANLYPSGFCSSLPSNYQETFCTIPEGVLGIDVFVWFETLTNLFNYYCRFLFCITLCIEIWSIKDLLSGASQAPAQASSAAALKQETTAESHEPDKQATAAKTESEVA